MLSFVFMVLGFVAQAGESMRLEPRMDSIWKKAGEIALRIKGKVLGSFVRDGMTVEQAEVILGMTPSSVSRFSNTNARWGWNEYEDLGVTIRLFHNLNDVDTLRVNKVTFKLLFE
jgi:hypothetical protein